MNGYQFPFVSPSGRYVAGLNGMLLGGACFFDRGEGMSGLSVLRIEGPVASGWLSVGDVP